VLEMECSSTGVSLFLYSIFFLFSLPFKFKTRTTRPDTVVSADPKNQCHFFCSTSQPLAQQSQTLFFIPSCKGNQKKGTSGWRKHCGFLFSNLYMWKDLKFIFTDVWYLNHPSVSYLWHWRFSALFSRLCTMSQISRDSSDTSGVIIIIT